MIHHWTQAPNNDWGCTFEVAGGQCCAPAIVACLGRSSGCRCDGFEGRCQSHLRREDFPKQIKKKKPK